MDILIKVFQLILSLSILILVHEFGHFIAARIFKVRVEKFYLFFNPWFSIFKFKKGHTTYGLGWLPFGGYVKISGMIDESLDKNQMASDPQPWEFRSRPAWQRLVIILAGISMNFLLAFIIYIFVLYIYGYQYLPTKNVTTGIACDSLALQLGLRDGDHILQIDDKKVQNFLTLPVDILLNNPKTITVQRNGEEYVINVNSNLITELIRQRNFSFISAQIPTIIERFDTFSVAQKAGLARGDQIIGIDTIPTPYFHIFRKTLQLYKDKEVMVKFLRGKDTLSLPVHVPNTGRIGIFVAADYSKFFKFDTLRYSFFEAIPAGISFTIQRSLDYLKQLKIIFTPKTRAYESLGGFITIGSLFPAEWDWFAFWNMTSFLSIILAIMNFLPIPALDGGHVLFILFEMISGRKPSQKFLEYAQIAGMIFLLFLVLYANVSDVFRLFQ